MSEGFVEVDFSKCSAEKYICCGGKNDGTIYQTNPGPCEEVEGEPENSFTFDRDCCRCLPNTPTETRCPTNGATGVSPRPQCGSSWGDGWFIRQSREHVLVWDGQEIYWESSCTAAQISVPSPYVVGNTSYYIGIGAGSMGYGWPSDCDGCGPKASPNGDVGSAYCITRVIGEYRIEDYLGQCDKEP